jgi:hypothetical protein
MINSEPSSGAADAGSERDAALNAVLRTGATGAVVLAGLATAAVVAMWLAFYVFVFMPRAIVP